MKKTSLSCKDSVTKLSFGAEHPTVPILCSDASQYSPLLQRGSLFNEYVKAIGIKISS